MAPNALERTVDVGPREPPGDFESPHRIQTNILAERERVLLIRLCQRMPDWITPDRLTAIGSVGAVIASLGYIASNLRPEFLLVSSLGVLINWFGDSLDGSLARYRNIERPRFGFFVDHSTDAINNLIFVIGLGLSPYVCMNAALFLLCSYYLLNIHVFLLGQVDRRLPLTYAHVGPTELRLLTIGFNIFIYVAGPIQFLIMGTKISLYSLLVALEAAAFVGVFLFDSYAMAKKLRRQDEGAIKDLAEFNASDCSPKPPIEEEKDVDSTAT
jgi:phosphatidylglycerophosphate synthase